MIQHVWSVLCQRASFDMQTNSVSLFNALENISVIGECSHEKPFILSCEIVSLWAREKSNIPDEGQLQAYLMTPSGKDSLSVMLDIDLTKAPFHRTRITVGAIPLTRSGRFEFCIDYHLADEKEWRSAARLPFILSVQQTESRPAIS